MLQLDFMRDSHFIDFSVVI